MSDLAVAGVPEPLLFWLQELSERAAVPPLLDSAGLQREQQRLSRLGLPDAHVTVDPGSGFWAVRHGPWLITTEPWCTECLMGSPLVSAYPGIPASTGSRVPLYQQEAARRRTRTGEGVPDGADAYLAELWLPARPAPPFDYNVVQVGVWRVRQV